MPLKDGSRFRTTSKLCPSAVPFARLILVFMLCLVSGGTRSFSGATTSERQLITAGAAVVRDLGAGDVQIFEISLNAGQLLQFSLEKRDLRLSLTVYGPAQQKLIEQVSHSFEVLEVSVPADASGVYRIEIRSLEQNEKRGQIELKVAPLRSISNSDLKDGAARQLTAEASVRRAEWTEFSLGQAIEKYREANLIWVSLRNGRDAARSSIAVGEVYSTLGQYREALKHYQQAADLARRAGDSLTESQALSEAGRISSYLGDNDAALAHLQKAINYFANNSQAGQADQLAKYAHARALTDIGEVYYSKGDLVKASRSFEQSLKLFTELGDRSGQARARLFAGYIAGSVGEPEAAFGEISQALSLYREAGNKTGEGLSLTALGLSYSRKRDEEHAIKMHLEARDIFRAIGDRQSEAITVNALGQAYEHLRDYPLALNNYQQALKFFEANGSLDLASVDLYQIASVYRLLGDQKQALSYYEQCIKLTRVAGKTRMEAYALNEVAAIYASQRNRDRTYAQYQKILSFYSSIGDHVGQALALNNLGDFLLSLGDKQKAIASYKKALPLSQHATDRGVEISTLYNLARASRDEGALDEALSYIKASVKIIEELRANVASPDFRTSYFAGLRRNYDLYIEILMKLHQAHPDQGFAVAALLASESARARTLVEILTEARADIRQDVDSAVLKRERELQGLLQSQAQYQLELASSGANQTEAAEVESQIDLLRAEYQSIQAQLREQNPRLQMLMQPAALSLPEIQCELDTNTILLEYALGEEKSYLWVVTVDSLRSYELPSRATLEDAASKVYKLVTRRQGGGGKIEAGYQPDVAAADGLYYEQALDLSRKLFGQAIDQLGNKRLLIVTEGALQYVPLDALPMPVGPANGPTPTLASANPDSSELPPLIAAHEIVTLPSMATLAAIRRERPRASSRNKVVAVLADPVFSADDDRVQTNRDAAAANGPHAEAARDQPAIRDFVGLKNGGGGGPMRLAHSSEEADAILAAAPRGVAMAAKGFDASRETAMSAQVAQYQILHLATHGFINSEHPELSGIVLTMVNRDGSSARGFLQLHDIYNLNLSANLTVLSACDTALGKDIKGEGLIGLTRGFMHAGSRSVVASLWKVDDRATAIFMGYFYKAMLQDGLPPAAALRAAKETMRQQSAWKAPYFWAGFVLQGEYNQTIKVDRDSSLGKYLAVSLFIGAAALSLLFIKWRRSRVQPAVRRVVQ